MKIKPEICGRIKFTHSLEECVSDFNDDSVNERTIQLFQLYIADQLNKFDDVYKFLTANYISISSSNLMSLSDITVRYRRYLLLICAISLVILFTGIIPKEIPALGLKTEDIKIEYIYWAFLMLLNYYFTAFIVSFSKDKFNFIKDKGNMDTDNYYKYRNSITQRKVLENAIADLIEMQYILYSMLNQIKNLDRLDYLSFRLKTFLDIKMPAVSFSFTFVLLLTKILFNQSPLQILNGFKKILLII